jgi:hypothetical protein
MRLVYGTPHTIILNLKLGHKMVSKNANREGKKVKIITELQNEMNVSSTCCNCNAIVLIVVARF